SRRVAGARARRYPAGARLRGLGHGGAGRAPRAGRGEVKFLLNVNTPRALGRRLLADGHACRHAADAGLGRAPDEAIVQEARANGEVILTNDLDYGHLLAFSGLETPSVVI